MSDCLFCGAEGSVDRVTRTFEFEYKGKKSVLMTMLCTDVLSVAKNLRNQMII
ncbi:hypothetical protein MASR1M90_04450 [Desulfovibrionales bacterium]